MPRRDNNVNYPLIVGVIVASALLHGLLWPVGDKVLELSWSAPTLPRSGGVMEVALIPPPSPADAEEPPPEDELELPPEEQTEEDDRIVQLDRVHDERPPEQTDNRSEFDNRVDQETKAPNRRPVPGQAPQVNGTPNVQPSDAEPQPPSDSRSLELGTRGMSKAESGVTAAEADRAELDRGEAKTQGAPVPPRTGLLGTPSALAETFGSSGTFDDLPGVTEGDENQLNSKRFKYASFFNRVRNAVAQHWEPAEVHRAADPDGRVFGAKTRRTNLVIRLNADGSLAKIMLHGSSDARHLDEEAIRAVRAAAPFDNPPDGLVDPKTGYIEFGFGFIFELRGGARIFRYQR